MANKILICDDDEGILDMLEVIFSYEGFDVTAETNSLKVHELILAEAPDLVMIDLWMPVISGDQVVRALREDPQTANILIMVISASNDGRQIALEAGANDFQAKPFDIEKLVARIHDMLSLA